MYPLQHILTFLDMSRKIFKGILPSTGKAFLHWLQKELQSYIYKKQKIFSKKQKGFRDGLSHSTPQKS